MRLRKALGAAVGAVGATAVANRVLQSRPDEFEPFLAGTQRTYRWRGFDVAYTEAGDPEDPDLVLLHGINAAGSSHEFHTVFEALAEDYHVVAPDLPGFGHSDRPPLLYSASLLTTFVRDFLADEAENPTVVASSLTAAYAAEAAREVDVAELILVCPTDTSMGNRNVWLRSLLRAPVVGQAIFNLIGSRASIRHFHDDHGYYDMANLSDEVVDYEWQSAHQPGARFAPASFVSGFLDPEGDLGETLSSLDVPVTLVWGEDADITPLSRGRDLADEADATLVVFSDSLLLPHVEHPEEFVDVVRGETVRVRVENDD
ncbi:alpha/beta fold hydrolase [Haloarcula litorea]|uniref:alpha/beta fold hydrolase n=1 Tax=Haloarcula litorea TaxID=3032579 RepID=UPI0023E7B5AD|nr:alpha/beta hydrolase [Halomicroarcula sp. GDY20]